MSVHLPFRKPTQSERRHSRAAWERPPWMANLSDCGTTERGKETARDVPSGKHALLFYL